jgi:hypothetical protein
MDDTATAAVDLSEAATVVVPPPQAEVPVLGREHIVAADLPADEVATGARAAQLLDGLIAWHNRMPWARRLQPEQVGQAGVVRFAFGVPQGPSDPAELLQPLFVPEKLVAGLSAKQLLAFVRRHGFDTSPAPAQWPLRELSSAAGADGVTVHWRYLLSAAYPATYGEAPLRALVGRPAKPGGMVAVGGRRGVSLPRVGMAAGGLAVLALAGLWGLRLSSSSEPSAAPPVAASAPQAKAPASAVARAVSVAASAVAVPVVEHTPALLAPAPASSQAHVTASPQGAQPVVADHEAALPRPEHPPPPAKFEQAPVEASPATAKAEPPKPEAAKPRPTTRPIPVPSETEAPTASLGAAKSSAKGLPMAKREPLPASPNFALVTATSADPLPLVQLRRRLRQAMGREGEALQLELQPAPGGQVLALWPIANRQDATGLAETLRQAGVTMRVVEF